MYDFLYYNEHLSIQCTMQANKLTFKFKQNNFLQHSLIRGRDGHMQRKQD
jgi:hypothetical protein